MFNNDKDNIDYCAEFGSYINNKEKEKFIKYQNSLGNNIIEKFSPITFDIYGGIGPETFTLLDSKFERFAFLRDNIDNDRYDKALKWFLKRISIITAKFNFVMFANYYNLCYDKFCANNLNNINNNNI